MQAVVIYQFGDPKNLKIENVPTPQPHGDEVLVQIKSAAINPSDVKNVAGTMHGTTLPRIPGRDFAGIVAAGAPDLLGKEVWGTGGDIGFTRDGSHAEYILLPRAAVTLKPAALSMAAAGNAGLTFITAWSAMVTAAKVSSGETAVIIGAAGGVGSAAVQIAKAFGARVIGVVRSDKEFTPIRQNGVDDAINSTSANLIESVRSMTSNRGADIVFDTTGLLFAEAVEIAATHGRISIISAPPDGKASFNLRSVYRKILRIDGIDTRDLDAVASARLLAQMTSRFESGQFKSTPAKPFPLSSAVEAYAQASRGGGRSALAPGL
jgi:NADPH2:quinone reductase